MAAKQGVKEPITSIYEKDEGKTFDISDDVDFRLAIWKRTDGNNRNSTQITFHVNFEEEDNGG